MLGLRILPFHSAPSCLKKLVAQNCDIESLPDNLFHYNWEEVDLMGNKGEGETMACSGVPKNAENAFTESLGELCVWCNMTNHQRGFSMCPRTAPSHCRLWIGLGGSLGI